MGIPVRWVRDKYKIPVPKEGEEVLEVAQSPADTSLEPEADPESAKMAEKEDSGPYYRALNKFEQIAEIPRIDIETSELITAARTASAPLYDAIKVTIAKQVKKQGIIKARDYTGIDKIKINVGDLKPFFTDVFLKGYLMGRGDVVKLTRKQVNFAEGYSPDKSLEALARKTGMTRAEYDALAAEMKGKAITVAGLEKSVIEKEVKTLLFQSIKNGWDYDRFSFHLDEQFIKYSMPVYGGVGEVGDAMLDYHVETVLRTNTMDVYNQGRVDYLSDSAVVEAFPAWFISEIIDGRTRPIHRLANGLTFMANDPIWRRLKGPNGYNCRLIIIPISKYDFTRKMLSSYNDIPRGYPDPGFG